MYKPGGYTLKYRRTLEVEVRSDTFQAEGYRGTSPVVLQALLPGN